MYLCDKHIEEKLTQINFETNNPAYEFEASEQIQPSSIDLRLSNIFWLPQKGKTLDLRTSALLELAPRRYWKKRILGVNECITLKPGKLLLGCIYEKFSIPTDCAGKIEGRSSFARMGLTIHCTGDYINPGYRGHMPLELYNFSPNPIKIFPYIPICQLMLIRLSETPERLYGIKELQSKYMDDDGGPSYWWRDKRIKALQDVFHEMNIELGVQERLLQKIGIQEPEIIERFEQCVSQIPAANIENADTLLGQFTRVEDKLKIRNKILKRLALILFPTMFSTSLGILFMDSFGTLHIVIWALTFLFFWPFILTVEDKPMKYLGRHELLDLQRNAQ
ncbi:dCTP deaminase [Candidatus Pacearchaeota archaeon]|nr:dCTP deaminase [Candidatus Pacearchaeota archaeon]